MATSASPAPAVTRLPLRPDWLALTQEAIIDPGLKIIDPHHHLWDHPGRRYMFDELLADISTGHNVLATVFVQCSSMYRASGPDAMKPVGETEFVNGIAAMSASGQYGPARMCAGIVGSVDYTLGDDVAPVLEAHIQAACGRFRGIRARTGWHASPEIHQYVTAPDVMADPRTHKAIRRIAQYGLTNDVWAYHTQMGEVAQLCKACPDAMFIINHVGGPLGTGPFRGQREAIRPKLLADLRELAAMPNTVIKLGGLAMWFGGLDYHLNPAPPTSDQLVADYRPYIEPVIEAFGPSRCMFESNFPVDRSMVSYPVLWNAFKKLAKGYSQHERDALFHGTAGRIYRIEV